MNRIQTAAATLVMASIGTGLGAETITADIVINGGSFSSPAAALEAARVNPDAQILLLEPTDWLGGQATTQGVSAIDNAWHDPGASLMRNNPPLYYPADYLNFLQRIKDAPAAAPGEGMAPNGTGWVTREAFDPRTAVWALDAMIAEKTNITVMRMTVLKQVATADVTDGRGAGKVITGLTLVKREPINGYVPHSKYLSQELPDWYSTADSADFHKTVYNVSPRDPGKRLVVIDASELADAIVLSGAKYTVGRELTTEKMGEDGSLPAMDEDGSQAFVYPFCMVTGTTAVDEESIKTAWADYATYYATQTSSYFSLGSYSWQQVWTYRRLKTGGSTSTTTVNLGDVSMQNWNPGNDYPYGTMYKTVAQCAAEAANWAGGVNLAELSAGEKHATAWYFWMKANKPAAVTNQVRLARGDDAMNMMGTEDGLSKFPYIRCTRRAIGLDNFRLLDRYFVPASTTTPGTSFRFYDAVGIGNYAADVHANRISTGISPKVPTPAPFYIPYRALGSANVRNLLVAGKTLATTYPTNSAYRLHPIEWAIGDAAGVAAALMARDNATNYDLLELTALRELQTKVRENSPIHWTAYDSQPIVSRNGDLVLNDNKEVTTSAPFTMEIYHHSAVRAEVLRNGVSIGSTTTRANGRLVFANASAIPGSNVFQIRLYDATDTLIDATMSATVTLPEATSEYILDNGAAGFSTVGTWTAGTAQADKYGDNYQFNTGGTGADSATYLFSGVPAGRYEVATWYPAASNRATDSPFTIHHAAGASTVRVNQQTNSGRWVLLGTYDFVANPQPKVVLTDQVSDSTKLVLADAIRLKAVPAAVQDYWIFR